MKYTTYIIAVLLLLTPFMGSAQDGEGLFKSKCNVCHIEDKASTGPILKGVKAKWEEAGEGELLYEWVKDPQALIASGKSEMAMKAKELAAGSMNAQQVSNEEIDAILAYVDDFVRVEKTGPPTGDPKGEVTYVPNYEQNLTLFYFLLSTAFLLLIAIITMSGTVIRFVKSPYFKKNAKDGNHPLFKAIILLIGFSMFFSNDSFALEFMQPGQAEEGAPWLKVENMDVYVLILLNLVLVFVLFYVRRMMKVFMTMTKDPDITEEESVDVGKKVNAILTDVVPIEEEHTILLHHEYDGIKELDNNLPPWWVWMFYGTIIFGIIYTFNYHILGTGDLQTAEYNKSMKQAEKEIKAYREANAMNIDASTATMMTEESDLSTGKVLFGQKCVLCHNQEGEGDSGPNLTDEAWIYGYEIGDVFESIQKGRPAGGMPAHESEFNPKQIQQIASYVLSLPFKEGSAPKGSIIKEKK